MIFQNLLLLLLAALSLAADFQGWPSPDLNSDTTKCLDNGKKRYDQLQSDIKQGKTEKSAVPWCEVVNNWNPRTKNPMSASQISARLSDFIQTASLGPDTGASNWVKVTEYTPKDFTPGDDEVKGAFYEQAYNAKDNAIAVVDITRTTKDVLDVTSLTWTTWVKACGDYGGDTSKLSQLIHYSCVNDLAKSVALDIFGEEPEDGTFYNFTPGDDVKDQPFYVLLGLDNG
jgi:hypothetical protein